MPTIYQKTTDLDRHIAKAIKQWHPDLEEAKATVNVLWAETDDPDAPALKHHGYPALAIIKVNSLKDRASGLEDVTLIVDKRKWDEMQEAERMALIDHELTHIEVKRKKPKKGDEAGSPGKIKRDDLNRPSLGTIPHDIEIGAFKVVIERHKHAAIEAQQLTEADKWMKTVVLAWG